MTTRHGTARHVVPRDSTKQGMEGGRAFGLYLGRHMIPNGSLIFIYFCFPTLQDVGFGNPMDQSAPAATPRVDEDLQFQLSLRYAR